MTFDGVLVTLSIILVFGPLVRWLANIFTIRIAPVAIQLYLVVVISFIVYIVVMMLRPAS